MSPRRTSAICCTNIRAGSSSSRSRDRPRLLPGSHGRACTAALLLEVDPIGLVRGRKGPPLEGFALGQYVNDRPYAASSMLAVAMSRVFKTAMAGRCDARPELAGNAAAAGDARAGVALPRWWRAGRPALRAAGLEVGRRAARRDLPGLGRLPIRRPALTGTLRLADALNQLYVLLPVLDDAKHYWVSPDEVDKLSERARAGWPTTRSGS